MEPVCSVWLQVKNARSSVYTSLYRQLEPCPPKMYMWASSTTAEAFSRGEGAVPSQDTMCHDSLSRSR